MKSEETIYQNEETQIIDNRATQVEEPEKKENNGTWKRVAIGGVLGMAFGGASVFAANAISGKEESEEEINDEELIEDSSSYSSNSGATPISDDSHITVDDTIQVAYISDNMSFGEAFAAAREQIGAAGVFEWNGGVYGTFYASEWDNMSAAEQAEFGSHINYGKTSTSASVVAEVTTEDEPTLVAEVTNVEVEPEVEASVEPEVPVEPELIAEVEAEVEAPVEAELIAEVEAEVDVEVEAPVEAELIAEVVAEPEVEVVAVEEDHDVQIIGVSEEMLDDGSIVTIGQVQVDGEDIFYIDTNGDGTFDVAAADLNEDGTISNGEFSEVQDAGITVDIFDHNMGVAQDQYLASNDAPDYIGEDCNLV